MNVQQIQMSQNATTHSTEETSGTTVVTKLRNSENISHEIIENILNFNNWILNLNFKEKKTIDNRLLENDIFPVSKSWDLPERRGTIMLQA